MTKLKSPALFLILIVITTILTSWTESIDECSSQSFFGTAQKEKSNSHTIQFFTDSRKWIQACPGSTPSEIETFQTSLVQSEGIAFCGSSISSDSSNCFAKGSILPGFEITADFVSRKSQNLVLITNDFLGWGMNVVGTKSTSDHAKINFTKSVNYVSFELFVPSIMSTFVIEVFGKNGSLGSSQTSSNSDNSAFFGALSTERITSIHVSGYNNIESVLFNMISFQKCI